MRRINPFFLRLAGGYLFPEIDRRVRERTDADPAFASSLVRCGIGDVVEPLPPAVIEAMHRATDEMARRATFRGYGPPHGYDFLREAIAEGDYRSRGLDVAPDEVFVSDGSKTDGGAILDVLATAGGDPQADWANRIAIMDPVYPVYVDVNVMAGNTGPARAGGGYEGLVALPCTEANGFVPDPPEGADAPDVVYLCFPNNPTGGMIDRPRLEAWVAWALEHDALLLYDAAYADYVSDPDLPRSIFEVDGARRCAIELRSFSKSGGFTGVRCGFTVCPRELEGTAPDGTRVPIRDLWARRWSTKSNSVAYVIQRAAEALYSDAGRTQVRGLVDGYLANARRLREGVTAAGLEVFGGVHAPYVWVTCPTGLDSWSMFDRLLDECRIVTTPGAGFGPRGEGYVRISGFNTPANIETVVERLAAADLSAQPAGA